MDIRAYQLHQGDALDAYAGWPAPAAIISDGAYGVRGFHGDTASAGGLAQWYRPHVEEWSRRAAPATTLWFWNTEVGWATVHTLLAAHGWEYVQAITWDKGIGHAAGNVNGKTIRRFPVVTEICVFYQRLPEIAGSGGPPPAQRCAWRPADGLTNVWQLPPLHGAERIKGTMRRAAPRVHKPGPLSAAHLNQKPLELMRRIVCAATRPGEVIWEPFGGLASASVAAIEMGRYPCAAEVDHEFAELAARRLDESLARAARGGQGVQAG